MMQAIQEGNKMDSRNLAMLFAPNLLHKAKVTGEPYEVERIERAEESADVIDVVREMIDSCELLFQVGLGHARRDCVCWCMRRQTDNGMLQVKEVKLSSPDYSTPNANGFVLKTQSAKLSYAITRVCCQMSASLHDEVLRKLAVLNSDALDYLLNYIVATNRTG
jgi:hypothetical protein